ncbi:type III pantothenate kinase [Acidihalobacter prosperus]|nr:type III pantothenate kinase [Acidihalobacter prosperus]
MTKTLLIDAGNSRVKWCWYERGRFAPLKSCEYVLDELRAALGTELTHDKPRYVVLSSVVVEDKERLVDDVLDEYGLDERLWLRSIDPRATDVQTDYVDPTSLGVDRYLALIAAYAHEKSALVAIGAGTATTIDALSDQGRHMGGVIMPGRRLMGHCIAHGITRLPRANGVALVKPTPFRTDTKSGLCDGAAYAWIGGVSSVLEDIESRMGRRLPIYVSGGDAEYLCRHLDRDVISDPLLIMKGLLAYAEIH